MQASEQNQSEVNAETLPSQTLYINNIDEKIKIEGSLILT